MTTQKHVYPKFVPSVSEYINAFKKIESELTDKQREMLINHHHAPCYVTTARDLAVSVGFKDYGGANLWYGKLGQMIAEAMDKDPYPGVLFLVTMAVPGTGTNTEWLWVMRTNVVLALEELGWVKKNSHLFNHWVSEEVGPDSE